MHLKESTELQKGKYRILHVLGQGGFGITYLAVNILLGKKVAIKEFFPKDFCGRDNTSHITIGTQNNAETVSKLKERFLKEARNITKLEHPGIVNIHDIFEENDTAYYVMDYIEGENLNEIVKKNGPMSEDMAVEHICQVGEALSYMHSLNMTHFDVKPANIVVRKKDNKPILIDFGLSKQYNSNGDATSTLMSAASKGYSPIEMYNAGNGLSFSPQTDVYSLGATLYYLLTGKTPLSASELLEKNLSLDSISSKSIREAINQAMQVNRNVRTKTASDFIKNLMSDDEADTTDEDTIYINNQKSAEINPTHIDNHCDDKPRLTKISSISIIGVLLLICYIISSVVEWGLVFTEKIYCLSTEVEHAVHYSIMEILGWGGENRIQVFILSILCIIQCIFIPISIILHKRYLISFIIIQLFLYPLIYLINSINPFGFWIIDFTKLTYIIPMAICSVLLICYHYNYKKQIIPKY